MTSVLAIALNPAIDVACEAHNVRPTFKTRTWNQRHFAGGGGTNVARVISELGGSPELLYLSGGETGSLFEHCLSRYPMRSHRLEIEGSTRIALMVHEKVTGFEYRFVPDGPEVRDSEIEPVHAFVEQHNADYVVASGSLPRGTPADTYCRIADTVHRRGGRVVLDTSGEALRVTLDQSRVFLLKPSMSELEKLVGEELDQASAGEAAASLVRRGVAENVAVSMGKQGAIFANSDGVVRVPSIRVREKSAVGAGDSFVGAMVWSLMEGHSLLDAFRFGVAAGSAAVMTSGTELCGRADVLRLFQENFENKSSSSS